MRHHVRSAINQLPRCFREILLIRNINGYDTCQTSKRLKISESLVKTRFHGARRAMRDRLLKLKKRWPPISRRPGKVR